MSDLKPCPFCGGKAVQKSDAMIWCENTTSCGGQIDFGHFFGGNDEESKQCREAVAEAWNRRT